MNADGSVAGLGWRSVWAVYQGVQYDLTDRIKVRAGYSVNANPVPSSQAIVNVATALIGEQFLSVGGSYQMTQNLAAHIAYTHGFENSLTGAYITPYGTIPGGSVTLRTTSDHLTVGVSAKF